MNKTLAIIGSGNLGQQIAHFAISDNHYSNVVFFDDFTNKTKINNFKVEGKIKDILEKFNKNIFDEIIIGIGYNHMNLREDLYKYFSKKIPFGKIIHSSCIVDNTSIVAEGCVLYPNSYIDARVLILSNTIINLSCTISHDSTIESHCFLAPRVAIAGFVKIDKKCFIGINSTIIDSIKIYENVKLGGGTVVIKDIIDSGVYAGNPSRKIK